MACGRAGGRLILLDQNVPALETLLTELEEEGISTHLLPLDLAGASKEHYLEVRRLIEAHEGRLDGLIYAAVHFDGAEPIASQPPERWFRTLHVNLNAPYLLCHTLFPLFKKAPARLVFLTDSALDEVTYLGAYGVSKRGLEFLVQLLASEWEAFGIQVHLVVPGAVDTPTRRKLFHGEGDLLPPESLAPLVVYLLSERCCETGGIYRHLEAGYVLRWR